MPTPAEEVVLRFADAVNRRDAEAAVAECDPDVEFRSVLASLEGRAFRGHAGIRRYFAEVAEGWDEWRIELHRVSEAAGDRVAIGMTMHLRGRASGAAFTRSVGHLWRLRDGKLWRLQPFDDAAGPFRASGLSAEAR